MSCSVPEPHIQHATCFDRVVERMRLKPPEQKRMTESSAFTWSLTNKERMLFEGMLKYTLPKLFSASVQIFCFESCLPAW